MIWNTALAFRIFCTLIAIAYCSGCGVVMGIGAKINPQYEKHVDLSESGSDEKATIRGETSNYAVDRLDCWITSPANAKRVTVNAGIVDFDWVCSWDGGAYRASNFRFEALAGHEYLIRARYLVGAKQCDGCVALFDVTVDEVVVMTPAPTGCYSMSCAGKKPR